jgi:DNA-binding CsgD family transcriptional regulator
LFCFYGAPEQESLNAFYLTHMHLLKKFCSYFLEKAGPIIDKGHANLLYPPRCYAGLVEDVKKKPPEISRSAINSFLSSIDRLPAFRMNKLSEREKKCIVLSAKGYSAKEIGEKLFISSRTVETHLKNAKIKFNCKNKAELIYYFLKTYPR